MPRTPKPEDAEYLTISDPTGPQTVRISHPGKLYFDCGTPLTKLDLVRYFLAIAPGALAGIADRPIVLKRFVNGACIAGAQPEPFYQKRAPSDLPPFLRTVTLTFPSGRTADELVVDTPAGLAWAVNLGCIELHPHPVRSADLDHPDQLRIDLDPNPGVDFAQVRTVALEVHALLSELGLPSFPKTSGSRGIHINVPIHPLWTFIEVRKAALALARAVANRIPTLATSAWWKEERHGVFLDYNQNAKDRTTASAYSARPLPDARVSAPLTWDELPDANPADFTVLTMPARFAAHGDPHAEINSHPASLEPLLELAARDEASGLADAPWPPHFTKQAGEAPRVQPSKAKSAKSFSDQIGEGFGEKRFRKRSKSLPPEASAPSSAGAPSQTAQPSEMGSQESTSTKELSFRPKARRAAAEKPASRIATESGATSQTVSPPEVGLHDLTNTVSFRPERSGVEKPASRIATESGATSQTVSPPEAGLHDLTNTVSFRPERSGVEKPASAPTPDSQTKTTPKRRTPKFPLITIAQSPDRAAAEAGLARWKQANPEAAALLAPDDILIDRMRGTAQIWYRIRINLRHVPEPQRPPQQTPDPDDDPTRAWREAK